MGKRGEGEAANRRDFLKLASAAVPAAAVAAATGTAAQAAEPEGRGEGLRDTPHTRTYYESARF